MMKYQLFKISAWLCLGVIIFVTVSPIGLRPHDILPVNADRALAFCLMSALFVLAYPKRWFSVLLLTIAGAGVIETLQFLSPTRHPQIADTLVKAGGAATGVLLAASFNLIRRSGKRHLH